MNKDEYHWMYNTALWRARRINHLQHHPLCDLCLARGDIVAATVVHHTTPHGGNWEAFVSTPLQSLCTCHNSLVQSEERLGFKKGVDVHGAPHCADWFERKKRKNISNRPGGRFC
jgi:5-methylcytosine-specific restriction enzyme A